MIRSRAISFAVAFAGCVMSSPAALANCTVPNPLSNGQVADASQVMGNFEAVADCADEAVKPTGTPSAGQVAVFSGSKTVTGGNLTGDVTTSGGTVTTLAPTGVAPGDYVNTTIRVDAKGRIIAAANGSSGSSGGSDTLFPIHPPTTSLFTLSNNGTGVSTSVNGGSKVYSVWRTDVGLTQERVGFVGKAVPAGDNWDATLGFWSPYFGRDIKIRVGICALENATGRNISTLYWSENGTPQIVVAYRSNLNSYGGSTYGPPVFGGRQPFYFRISYDGVNYYMKISWDFMETWSTVATMPKATYFTTAADRIGICLGSQNGSGPQWRLDSFYYSDPDVLP